MSLALCFPACFHEYTVCMVMKSLTRPEVVSLVCVCVFLLVSNRSSVHCRKRLISLMAFMMTRILAVSGVDPLVGRVGRLMRMVVLLIAISFMRQLYGRRSRGTTQRHNVATQRDQLQ